MKNKSGRLGRYKNRNEAGQKIWIAETEIFFFVQEFSLVAVNETEIYPMVLSNGLPGIRKIWKRQYIFEISVIKSSRGCRQPDLNCCTIPEEFQNDFSDVARKYVCVMIFDHFSHFSVR